jgi:hypothetical protein
VRAAVPHVVASGGKFPPRARRRRRLWGFLITSWGWGRGLVRRGWGNRHTRAAAVTMGGAWLNNARHVIGCHL